MVLCASVYDPPHGPNGGDTHNCDQTEGHGGPHHCDICGTWWTARTGIADPEATEATERSVKRQVAMARQDAHLVGTGWVMITRGPDGGYEYQRIRPDQIMMKVDEDDVDPDDVVIP